MQEGTGLLNKGTRGQDVRIAQPYVRTAKSKEEERETSTDQGKTSQITQDEKEEFVPKKGAIFVMCHVNILWIFHFKIKPTKQCNENTRCVARSKTKAKQLHRLKTLEESFTRGTLYKKKLR